ncbi:hypothetical protein MTR67_014453 [Solanum verrucosum]|uniref:Uncharacterized protein n=1 Tax=Solanum verrucosum TaxID=315347 RepID=A0AAF0TN42_SOLVR|nr:hypothetical protein MTR67_014453 [Solanum verrucosum]
MLWESSTLCHLELISNIHRQRDSIINEVCDEQADEVADTANLHGEYELRGCKQQNELDSTRYIVRSQVILGTSLCRKCLPQQLSRLSRLQNLNLSFNYLTGEIPVNLSHCVNLKSLVLEHNALLGKIPNQQSTNAPFEDNQFVGTLPHSTVNLSSQLQRLLYYGNKISGSIPIGLTGTIPQQLFSLSSLTDIYVSYNSLTGPLLVYIGNWSHLTYLDFSHSNFSGMIPRTLGKCLALEEIYLKGNSLQGTIPNLEDLPDLQSLDLSLNNLSGPIPHFIANLTSLLYLNLSFNNLEDEVPVTRIFSNLSADV